MSIPTVVRGSMRLRIEIHRRKMFTEHRSGQRACLVIASWHLTPLAPTQTRLRLDGHCFTGPLLTACGFSGAGHLGAVGAACLCSPPHPTSRVGRQNDQLTHYDGSRRPRGVVRQAAGTDPARWAAECGWSGWGRLGWGCGLAALPLTDHVHHRRQWLPVFGGGGPWLCVVCLPAGRSDCRLRNGSWSWWRACGGCDCWVTPLGHTRAQVTDQSLCLRVLLGWSLYVFFVSSNKTFNAARTLTGQLD